MESAAVRAGENKIMSKGIIALIVIVGLALAIGGSAISSKNGFVSQDEAVTAAWANVETVLQRRYDLIPNLVNTVKGFAAQEKSILEEVTRLRSQWGQALGTAQKVEAAGQMEGALARLLVVAEKYPDLKSNQNFLALQDELAGTENRISVERRRFNEAVQGYNTKIRRFPGSIWAGVFGFERRKPFESVSGAAQAPDVKF